MIKTHDLLMVRLQWPAPPEDYTVKQVKHWKKILAAGRRCLHNSAPVTFHNTGFQLLRKNQEPEMLTCLSDVLEEIDLNTEDVLVTLPAPEPDRYCEGLYQQSFEHMLHHLSNEIDELQGKLTGSTQRVDSFNQAFKLLDIISGYIKSDELIKIHQIMIKLEQFDFEDDNAKGIRLMGLLAKKILEVKV